MIVLEGEIFPGDADRFDQLSRDVELAGVLLKSPGGSLLDGIDIGRRIRELGYSTGVAPNTACASACALAWLGGKYRFMDPSALVGFHAAYSTKNGVIEESAVGNALVGAYLRDIGLDLDAIIFATQAAPEEISWLTPRAAQLYGIQTTILTTDGRELEVGSEVPLRLPNGFRWIVIESANSSDMLRLQSKADQVVRTQNGYYASVIGPFEKAVAEQLILQVEGLPNDAYLSSGNGFVSIVRQ